MLVPPALDCEPLPVARLETEPVLPEDWLPGLIVPPPVPPPPEDAVPAGVVPDLAAPPVLLPVDWPNAAKQAVKMQRLTKF